ncbi:hypothetical protein TVAG_010730 [Trichomonas vaginalis G3]|uniref:Uncharacterized protein n=1 Tax=Trichomonas vaginalis (strain ATCC PRA-98 / G3) TaxID=412133 RepID=A2DP00_TRIV3|nr:pectin lyase-like family [Trichomonas vaginalis G3]EAY17849.1 hypothetical protein TVAG_010730 [Trichomonas vaginalis G3]KAI5489951.1 pectin lyase-like family [Trichomonas vaginalis G3]|eukprot:XP_001329984.1 hypothetical protein [Trichomonas vaginalis G3]
MESNRLVYIDINATIVGNTFQNLISFKGAAIYLDIAYVHISDNYFVNNSASIASSIYLISPLESNITSNVFSKCQSKVLAGALLCESSTISNNSYHFLLNNFTKCESASVSALDIWDGNPIIGCSCFFNNSGNYKFGSLRTSSKKPNTASVMNCIFDFNKSPMLGAAYSVYWFSSTAEIQNSTFIGSTLGNKHGGSICSTNNGVSLKLFDCNFQYTEIEEIQFKKMSSSVEISECKFSST